MHRISNIRPILKQFLGSSYAQNGAHEHYTAPDGQTGKYALPSNIQGLNEIFRMALQQQHWQLLKW